MPYQRIQLVKFYGVFYVTTLPKSQNQNYNLTRSKKKKKIMKQKISVQCLFDIFDTVNLAVECSIIYLMTFQTAGVCIFVFNYSDIKGFVI